MKRYDIRFRYCTLFIACTILLFCSISASAGTITDSVVWGTWIMKYVMGNGADGLNASIDGGTRIYYIFNDDQMWGYSVFTDGTSDALAARSYSISDGKLEFPSGETMDIFLADGVLHLSESGTEMLFIRGDIDFLEGSWDYVAISDDTQPDTVQAVNEFFAVGGEINFTFKHGYVTITDLMNGKVTDIKDVSYSIVSEDSISMYNSEVEVLIAGDSLILTDGTTWQFYVRTNL